MSRLLFAAARGARIQEDLAYINEWVNSDCLPLPHDITDEFRIHPEDEHLAYGPISTALRINAESAGSGATALGAPHGIWWMTTRDATDYFEADKETRSLFLLILAEALADDGL